MPEFERTGKQDGHPGPTHVIVDAVADPPRGTYGLAYIATDGAWGMRLGDHGRRHDPMHTAREAKIRAVGFALEHFHARAATFRCDDIAVVNAWDGWQRNIPDAVPFLTKLRLPTGARTMYTFTWSHPSEGDPLAEWADSAARLAMRIAARQAARRDATRLLTSWAATRLHEWGLVREDQL